MEVCIILFGSITRLIATPLIELTTKLCQVISKKNILIEKQYGHTIKVN